MFSLCLPGKRAYKAFYPDVIGEKWPPAKPPLVRKRIRGPKRQQKREGKEAYRLESAEHQNAHSGEDAQ